MKRVSLVILAVLLVCSFAFTASAASAFTKITVNKDVPIVHNAPDDPGKQPAQFIAPYGIGYTAKDDYVEFKDLDFGTTGASTATIGFAFGTEGGSSTLLMYLDDINSKPIATFKTGFSGGWDDKSIKDYPQPVSIPAGKHTVFVKWTDATGSLHTINFTPGTGAAAATTTTTPAATTTTPATTAKPATVTAKPAAASTSTAPKAADMGMVTSLFALAMSGAAIVGLKKKR